MLECELGIPAASLDALAAAGEPVSRWEERSGYFGGVQAVLRRPDGELSAAGDPRRGGTGLVVR